MQAQVGDRLLVGPGQDRTGLVVGVPRDDGLPPYIVRWLSDGHIAMVYPDQYAQARRANTASRAGISIATYVGLRTSPALASARVALAAAAATLT
jgi:Domain of unknown function (DUF1918)